jgi:hypothetical protein
MKPVVVERSYLHTIWSLALDLGADPDLGRHRLARFREDNFELIG